MTLKKILFEKFAVPMIFTAGALMLPAENLKAQPIKQLGYYPVDNVPLTKISAIITGANSKKFYYVGKPKNFGKKPEETYLTVIPKNNGDYRVFFYLNPSYDTIIGVGLMSDVYSKETINDIILSVMDTSGKIMDFEEYEHLLKLKKQRDKLAEKNLEEIEKERQRHAFFRNLSKRSFYEEQWIIAKENILKMQEQRKELEEIKNQIKNEYKKDIIKQLAKKQDSVQLEMEKTIKLKTENERNATNMFFEDLSAGGFSLGDIQTKQFEDCKDYKLVFAEEDYFFKPNKNDSTSGGYFSFIFPNEKRIDHNILILTDKKNLIQFSVITEKTPGKNLENLLKHYINKKGKFVGEMYVFMNKYNLPLKNLLDVCAENNYRINRSQIKINRENKEIVAGLEKYTGKLNLLKQSKERASNYIEQRGNAFDRVSGTDNQ